MIGTLKRAQAHVERFLFTIVLAAGAIVTDAEVAYAVDRTWAVISGDWFTGSNWNPAGVPTSIDSLTIDNGGFATLSGPATVDNFTLTNGTLTGSGTLTVTRHRRRSKVPLAVHADHPGDGGRCLGGGSRGWCRGLRV